MIYVALDVETGGLDPLVNPILEIGAVKLDTTLAQLDEPFTVKVTPSKGKVIDPRAAEINGYIPEGWSNSVNLIFAMQQFRTWLRHPLAFEEKGARYVPMGSNPSFDLGFLNVAQAETGVSLGLHYHWIDVPSILWLVGCATDASSDVSLDHTCRLVGISRRGQHHSALEDALLVAEAARRVRKEVAQACSVHGFFTHKKALVKESMW